ncbi:glutathione S-transferase [Ameyamaea chiangmaiensis NBRC 103196]|uniref:GNAT family N-acetyltransferase n=2 Tax=Ameyamaea chiangmaiensis TaxID=442969 RepID=A0A850P5Q0_9PROT|nr:GNAT family N-acetyltransferase [Ameyamaea chiangmaiensis]NVN39258.1 GNAT family N-acetyltransferase [Ameyamaea chiangmaiensis]GBQ72180.1 glutathione S-transferase [Ameyamaea chiangmaiensis NBRC 103196]
MIDVHYWPTPNGHKITLMLEETRLAYRLHAVNIGKGDQFLPDFLAISPNNRIPAIVDHAPDDGGAPLSVFESGAILSYLSRKTGRFGGDTPRQRIAVEEWLFWQVGGLGPMAGQNHHFSSYAPEKIPYAIDRYVKETTRLYGVMDRRLSATAFLAGDAVSIADFAAYPWILPEGQGQDMTLFPSLARWHAAIAARPATRRAYALTQSVRSGDVLFATADDRNALFAQAGLRDDGADATDFVIRGARVEDAAMLPDVERSAANAFRGVVDPAIGDLSWIADDTVMSADDHRLAIIGGQTWVAVDEHDRPHAFLSASLHDTYLHIHEISVATRFQRRGVGRALLTRAATAAAEQGLKALTLTTFRTVPFNAPYYARLGFVEIPRPECPPWLDEILNEEVARGLPSTSRCAMILRL